MLGISQTITFGTWDWVIVIVYLAVIVGVGVSVKKLIRGVDSFIAAGKSVGIGLAIATMVGAELGLVTIAFGGQMGFLGGFAAMHVPLLSATMCLVVGLSGFIVYRLRKAGIITLPEYYQQRYGRKTRIVGGMILVLAGILNMGMFLKASAMFLAGVTGAPEAWTFQLLGWTITSNPVNLIMTALMLIVFIYTIIGGMLSVVLIDYLQFILIGSSFLIVTVLSLADLRYHSAEGPAPAAGAAAALVQAAPAAEPSPSPTDPAGAEGTEYKGWDAAVQALIAHMEAEPARLAQWAAAKASKTFDQAQEAWQNAMTKKTPENLLEAGNKTVAAGKAMQEAADAQADAKKKAQQPDLAVAAFNPLAGQGEFGILYVVWMAFTMFSLLALWQPATLRALIAANPKVAKRTYLWSSLGFLIRFMIPIFWGVCALAFVMRTPELRDKFFPVNGDDPLGALSGTPIYLGYLLPPIFKGVVVAGLLAAFLSTQDAYILCWSASTTQDIIAPFFKKGLSQQARVMLTRVFLVVIGVFLLVWSLWYPLNIKLWDYMAITANVYSAGAFAAIAGGLYWKRASSTGAIIAMLLGLLALVAILPWKDWKIQSVWLKPESLGLAVPLLSIAGMILGSLIFPDKKEQLQ